MRTDERCDVRSTAQAEDFVDEERGAGYDFLVAYAPPMANVNAIVVVTDVLQFSVVRLAFDVDSSLPLMLIPSQGAYATFVILVVTVYQRRTARWMIRGQSSFMASIRFVSPTSGADASLASLGGLSDGGITRIGVARDADAIEMTSRCSR